MFDRHRSCQRHRRRHCYKHQFVLLCLILLLSFAQGRIEDDGGRVAVALAVAVAGHNDHHHDGVATRTNKKHYRIAILIPFLSKSTPILPSYFSIFLQSVALQGVSSLFDFFIFHNGQLSPLIHNSTTTTTTTTTNTTTANTTAKSKNSTETETQSTIMDIPIPQNVKFVNLHNMTYFTSHLLDVMNVKRWNETSVHNEQGEQYKIIYKYYKEFLFQNPYALIEFKPALGYIFQHYINHPFNNDDIANNANNANTDYYYTHWGYSDLDIYFGDLENWITRDELEHYDIVTYGFGDQNRVYLRGQFTFHKNDVPLRQHQQKDQQHDQQASKEIYKLWTKCDYLYHFDTRFMQLIHHQKFQLESAEGCYSSVVVSASKEKKLKIKYAVKAWTNPKDHADMNNFGVSAIFLPSLLPPIHGDEDHDEKVVRREGYRNVLLKKSKLATATEYLHSLKSTLSSIPSYSTVETTIATPSYAQPQTKNDNNIYATTSTNNNTMQCDIGNKTFVTTNEKSHCMGWAPKQYQFNLCIDPKYNVTNKHSIFLIDGKLYKQSFVNRDYSSMFDSYVNSNDGGGDSKVESNEQNNVSVFESSSLFHMQEWKRNYRTTQLLPMKMSKQSIIGWTFYPEGVVPHFDKNAWKRTRKLQQQPYEDIETTMYNYNESRSSLPSQYFCLLFKTENRNGQYNDNCRWAVSWYDDDVYTMTGKDWGRSDYADITLTMTLHITSVLDETENDIYINSLMNILKANIQVWKNNPVIVTICLTGKRSKELQTKVMELLHQSIDVISCTNYLVGIIQKENIEEKKQSESIPISQKALLNMAESASLTRWTISGLALEKMNTIISKEALYFAKLAATAHGEHFGNVFVIPEFHIVEGTQRNGAYERLPRPISLSELLEMKRINMIQTKQTDGYNASNDGKNIILRNIQNLIHSLWTERLERSFSSSTEPMDEALMQTSVVKEQYLQSNLTHLLLDENIEQLEQSPTYILMIDRNPMWSDGIDTNHLISEIDELDTCMNLLRLAQLALFDYRIQILPGAFGIPSLRKELVPQSDALEQQQCNSHAHLVKDERRRIAKTVMFNNHL